MMNDLNPGECMYFPNEVIPENIRLLIKSGKLKKVSNKVYYKVGNGLLGEIPFNEDYYDDNVLIGVDHSNGYLTSYSFFNRMGFTTQVPVKRFIVSNVDSDIELVWTKVLKPKVKVTKENWRILQFLDFLEEINYIACFRADCAFNYLLRFFKWVQDSNHRLEELFNLAEYYPKEIQERLVIILWHLYIYIPKVLMS